MNYQVTYVGRDGVQKTATVKVDETTNAHNVPCFYATNLTLWGCGKNAASPEGAIALLVQDMATIVKTEREIPAAYRTAFDFALQMMEMEPDLEPRSALKQAASDHGIPYGDEMAAFVTWAEAQL